MSTRRLTAYLVAYPAWLLLGCVTLAVREDLTPAGRQRTRDLLISIGIVAFCSVALVCVGHRYFYAFYDVFQDDAPWPGTVLLMASVAFLIVHYLPQRQKDLTPRCLRCRYDLTGNVSGVCPECGTPVPAARRDAALP